MKMRWLPMRSLEDGVLLNLCMIVESSCTTRQTLAKSIPGTILSQENSYSVTASFAVNASVSYTLIQ